jgi:hypothetical protein
VKGVRASIDILPKAQVQPAAEPSAEEPPAEQAAAPKKTQKPFEDLKRPDNS